MQADKRRLACIAGRFDLTIMNLPIGAVGISASESGYDIGRGGVRGGTGGKRRYGGGERNGSAACDPLIVTHDSPPGICRKT